MKRSNITALFKKGSKSASQNYRPVSLTAVICKQMELIIKDEIIKHSNIFKLINGSQHGFTKGRSGLTNLLEIFEKIMDAIDKGKPFDCIYLDFAKAFDMVPHFRLIKKIKGTWSRCKCGKMDFFLVNWKEAAHSY